MTMTLEDFLEQEWSVFLGGMVDLSDEALERMYVSWSESMTNAYYAMEKQRQKELFLETAEERVDTAEVNISDSQDAIAELGVLAADNSISVEDLMNAIAELGALVATALE